MLSSDILDDFLNKLKKEKIEYFIFLTKKPSKKQKLKNPANDLTIAHYQNLSQERFMILYYCLSKMLATGSFDPNEQWDPEDNEGESWQNG